MAGTMGSLLQNHALEGLFAALDPKSLILSQFSFSDQPQMFQLATDSFVMERGPRYNAYANLRESKLRLKAIRPPPQDQDLNPTPQKKQVKFQGDFSGTPNGRKGSSVLTQSVPDFSSALRKENRKPVSTLLPPLMEKSATPPAKSTKLYGVVGKLGGSKSANSGDKRNGGLMARKSYASIEELKGLSSAAATAISGEIRGRKTGGGVGKNILGYRQH